MFLKKKKLLKEEESFNQRKCQIEVKPKYIIFDTNTLIDYLEELKRLVNSKLFYVLIPTTGRFLFFYCILEGVYFITYTGVSFCLKNVF